MLKTVLPPVSLILQNELKAANLDAIHDTVHEMMAAMRQDTERLSKVCLRDTLAKLQAEQAKKK